MTSRPRRVPQLRIAETIAAELRDRILASDDEDFRLPPQERLVEEFGVSYPSIREAFRILETEGLITVRRGNVGGAEVHRPDEASAAYHLGLALQAGRVTIGDLAGALLQLEPQCAAACAQRPDRAEAVVPALRANIETATELVDAGPDFTHAGREFHDLVVSHSPNATLRHVVGSLVALWSAQEQLWAQSTAGRGEYPSAADAAEALAAHRRIVRAIELGRPGQAEKAARAHLAATQEYLADRFDDVVVNGRSANVQRDHGGVTPRRQ